MSASGEDSTLAGYRSSIDNIDAALILLLAERFKITQQVGRHKAAAGLPPADPQREHQQMARLRDLSAQANLDPAFTEKFLRFVISEVIRHHDQARSDDPQRDAGLPSSDDPPNGGDSRRGAG
ncbi:MAG: chorismate mutase [Acidimicrobiaceae bacterium]|nr:chorismate mutase [Acidimicrobiaceae bacterium]MCY4281293.1 chorismate mutase [Acidimicrobiaceae bacterium]MCY4294990.1 chorismate mutase [Acidimicrobiaceae bacterium]